MNNHIKTCSYCQGDGVVPKTWDDIKEKDLVYYRGLYINCSAHIVKIDCKGKENGVDYWIVSDLNNISYPMFKINFKGFAP